MWTAIVPAGGEPAPVEIERLGGEQVDRDGVAGEGVEHDHVEALLSRAFLPEQVQPAVTEHHLHLRPAHRRGR